MVTLYHAIAYDTQIIHALIDTFWPQYACTYMPEG